MASDIVANNDLDTLAQRIRAAHEAFQNSMRNALRMVLDAGNDLLAAKAQVPAGTWQRWLRDHCFLSIRTAELYIQLAQHREEIERELERVADLSLSAARRLIMKPANKSDAESNAADGLPSKPDAPQLLPSWQAASDTQRSDFLLKIGLTALLAAMPPDMRNELEQRGLGSLKARAKTKKARAVIENLRKPPITIEGTATEIFGP
jgi:hypothetical protein